MDYWPTTSLMICDLRCTRRRATDPRLRGGVCEGEGHGDGGAGASDGDGAGGDGAGVDDGGYFNEQSRRQATQL